jgi:IrrE N-terminal-like domain
MMARNDWRDRPGALGLRHHQTAQPCARARALPDRRHRLAREYSAQRFPGDAITLAAGADLPGFDGALYRAPAGKSGWGIVYNDALTSPGRINFTLAHEFGHYLLHRIAYPQGIQCSAQDVARWDSPHGQIEHQANLFAANLLMPFDDFRRQIGPRAKVDLDMISHCADRYRVSLIAAILRWLASTDRRAVLVVSRDGFILWSRASAMALKTGAFFRTSGGPVEIPTGSLAATQDQLVDGRAGLQHGPGVWFAEPLREMTIFSEQYDFTITLLLLADRDKYIQVESDAEEDTYDRLTKNQL